MEYSKEDIASAVNYAETVKVTAEISPDDEQSFIFNHDPPIPES